MPRRRGSGLTSALALMAPHVGVSGVAVRVTTRRGGVSCSPYRSLNLGDHVDDQPEAVQVNRQRLHAALGLAPVAWLRQVHGCRAVQSDPEMQFEADAQWTTKIGQPIAVLTADCLPVVLASNDGACVGVAHAGWRGLAAGVLQALIADMPVLPSNVTAWLGPAIGPKVYEVGPEVYAVFEDRLGDRSARCFVPSARRPGHFMADLFALARLALTEAGVSQVNGGGLCSYTDAERFFSHRRDGPTTGRFATLVWRESPF